MPPSLADRALRQFQRRRNPAALAVVFDRTAPELLALARHLCRGSALSAEDVLQETFLTALERIDQYDPARRALPWLLGILTNRVREARRRLARDGAEGLPVDRPTAGSPEAAAVASELHDAVTSAIEKLPDVYRPVLRLHLERGMSAAEIARTLERPAGTVRAQISRGLDALRRHLPAALAAGSTMAALAPVRAGVLAARFGSEAAAPAASITTTALGAFVMLHKPWLAATTALFVLAALALATRPIWIGAGSPESPATPALARSAWPTGEPPSGPTDDPARATLETAPDSVDVPSPVADEPPGTLGSVTITVRPADDPTGTVAGIGVGLAPMSALLDMGRQIRYSPTDENGRVTFTGLAPEQHLASLDRGGRGRAFVVEPGVHTEIDLTLSAGVTLSGVVHDADGRPAPGASIWIHGNHTGTAQVGVADANGAFAIAGIAPESYVQARLSGHQPSAPARVDGAPGSKLEMDLELLGEGRSLRGRVLDPSGRPVPFADLLAIPDEVQGLYDGGKTQRRPLYLHADANGEFETHELPADAIEFLARGDDPAFAPGFAKLELTEASPGWLDITLTRGAAVEGRLTRAGQPVADAAVQVYSTDFDQWANLLGMRITKTDDDGRFRLEGVLPGDSLLHAYAGAMFLADARLRTAAGTTTHWVRDLDLDPATVCDVHVEPPLDPTTGRPWHIETTDGSTTMGYAELDEGHASLPVRPNAKRAWIQVVRVEPSLGQRVVVGAFEARPGTTQTLVVPESQHSTHSLRARLLGPDRAPLTNQRVSLRWTGEPMWSLDLGTDENGVLTADSLPAGSYRIRAATGNGKLFSDPFPLGASAADAPPIDLVVAPQRR